jgi:alkylation response protein AidB-like acyl-CoA dehydrogenase
LSKTSSGERTATGWIINGSRPFSSGSHVADYIQISWENADGARLTAAVPADRDGIVIENDWDGIGQRQTGSGTVRFVNLEVLDDELISSPDVPLTPWSSLTSLLQQSVLLNVFVGSAQGYWRKAKPIRRRVRGRGSIPASSGMSTTRGSSGSTVTSISAPWRQPSLPTTRPAASMQPTRRVHR